MPLHGDEPEGRRVGKVYGPVGPSPSHSRSSFRVLTSSPQSPSCASLSFGVSSALTFAIPISLSPEPVAHKLIRSRCLLAQDSHWPPQSRRSLCSLCRSPPLSFSFSLSPSLLSAPYTEPRPPFFLFSRGPKYSRKLRDRTVRLSA